MGCDHRAVTSDRTLREELVGLLTASCGSRERMGKGDSCNYKSSGGDDRWLKMEIESGSEERLRRVPNFSGSFADRLHSSCSQWI